MNAEHIPMHHRWLAAGLAGLAVLMGSAVSQQAFAQSIDYDTDNDNLIEVDSLAKLNAIRYDLDGDGTASDANYATAFPTPATSMGCNTTCTGYELMANLDFDTDGSGDITNADDGLSWGSGDGWEPIGTGNTFAAEFHGNGHTISHLFINRPGTDNVGLFNSISTEAVVSNVGLIGVDVTGNDNAGGLTGFSSGTIDASYVNGMVSGDDFVGGLVGLNPGTIRASYVAGEVSGNNRIGGLVGEHRGTILASYATGEVTGSFLNGGLVGLMTNPFFGRGTTATIRASYEPVGLRDNHT